MSDSSACPRPGSFSSVFALASKNLLLSTNKSDAAAVERSAGSDTLGSVRPESEILAWGPSANVLSQFTRKKNPLKIIVVNHKDDVILMVRF